MADRRHIDNRSCNNSATDCPILSVILRGKAE